MSRRNKSNKILGFLTYIIICIFIGVGIFFFTNHSKPEETSAKVSASPAVEGVSESNPSGTSLPAPQTPAPSPVSALGQAVMSALEGTTGKYGVAIKNLKTGQTFFLDEHEQYNTGSLYKVWVMADVYKKVNAGDFALDDTLSDTIPNLNQIFGISPENAELTSGSITMTTSQALYQMITISHNYAAMLLTEKVKVSSLQAWLDEFGFKESQVGTNGDDPKTTAYDMMRFFEKLYLGQLTDADTTKKMIDTLKDQQKNNKLPLNLPDGVEMAHKTGEIDFYSHDAGIVYTSKGDYIIVVLSQTDAPAAAEDRIAQISKNVYDYFEK